MPGEHQGEPKLRPVSSFTLSDAGERAKLTARSTETTCPHTLTTEWVDCDSNSTNYHISVAQSISDRLKNLITRIYVGNCSAHFFEFNCLCSGQVQAEIPLGKGKENIMFWFNCSFQPNHHFCKWQMCPWLTFVPNMTFPFTINTYFLTFGKSSLPHQDGDDTLTTRLTNSWLQFWVC